MRDLYTRALYKISSQDLYERSLYKSSLQDLFTGPPYERSLYKSSLQDLVAGPPYGTSLSRALYKISSHLRHLYTRSPDIPDLLGLLTAALYKISSQDLHERSLYKSSLRSPGIPGLPRSLHRSSLQDLFTSPIWEISLQELSKISWFPWTS